MMSPFARSPTARHNSFSKSIESHLQAVTTLKGLRGRARSDPSIGSRLRDGLFIRRGPRQNFLSQSPGSQNHHMPTSTSPLRNMVPVHNRHSPSMGFVLTSPLLLSLSGNPFPSPSEVSEPESDKD
jgi:hypothetical protein